MTTPAVSIIVPCYNGGPFLDGMLASLDRQTFRDFETVIVDDGSTDQATLDVLDRLEAKARIIRQENCYLPGARNSGFREARARFVLPLDCDDRLEPQFLEETFAVLSSAPDDVGFVFTDMKLVGELGGVLPRVFHRFDQLFLNKLPYCMLIRKTAWEAAGGYDESVRDGGEDWEFNVSLAEAGYQGIGIPKPLFIYDVRQDGMLMSESARMQGTIWRQIRTKHRAAYRPGRLLALWRQSGSRIGAAVKAILLYGAATILPDAWFNALYFQTFVAVRKIRVGSGRLKTAAKAA